MKQPKTAMHNVKMAPNDQGFYFITSAPHLTDADLGDMPSIRPIVHVSSVIALPKVTFGIFNSRGEKAHAIEAEILDQAISLYVELFAPKYKIDCLILTFNQEEYAYPHFLKRER